MKANFLLAAMMTGLLTLVVAAIISFERVPERMYGAKHFGPWGHPRQVGCAAHVQSDRHSPQPHIDVWIERGTVCHQKRADRQIVEE